jgi:hypothetical protein
MKNTENVGHRLNFLSYFFLLKSFVNSTTKKQKEIINTHRMKNKEKKKIDKTINK